MSAKLILLFYVGLGVGLVGIAGYLCCVYSVFCLPCLQRLQFWAASAV